MVTRVPRRAINYCKFNAIINVIKETPDSYLSKG